MTLLALGVREYMLHREISDLRSSIISQLREHVANASTVARVTELQSSSLAFSRYLEPLFITSSQMIWGPSRAEALMNWRRELHTELEEQTTKKTAELNTNFTSRLEELRKTEAASLKRLKTALKLCEEMATSRLCTTLVEDELNAIQVAASESDQTLLKAVKTEGIARLKKLQKALASKSSKQLALYLTSGNYDRDIEKPVIDLVMKLKQLSLRNNAWTEFEKKRDELLGNKRIAVARAAEPRPDIAKRGIEKVTDRVTQALQLDAYFSKEEIDTPSDSGSLVSDDLESPSAASSVE